MILENPVDCTHLPILDVVANRVQHADGYLMEEYVFVHNTHNGDERIERFLRTNYVIIVYGFDNLEALLEICVFQVSYELDGHRIVPRQNVPQDREDICVTFVPVGQQVVASQGK